MTVLKSNFFACFFLKLGLPNRTFAMEKLKHQFKTFFEQAAESIFIVVFDKMIQKRGDCQGVVICSQIVFL